MFSLFKALFFTLFFLPFIAFVQVNQSDKDVNDKTLFTTPEVINVNLEVIESPEGFEVSPSFNGFIHYQASTAIIVSLIKKVNFRKLSEGMNQEFYKKNKLKYISEKKIVSKAGVKGVWYKFNFNLEGNTFGRYMVYAGDLNKTIWLNITYPLRLEDLIETEILKCIQSIDLSKIKE